MAKYLIYPLVVPATENAICPKGVEIMYWSYSLSRAVHAAGGNTSTSAGTLSDQASISDMTVAMTFDPETSAKFQYQLIAAKAKTTEAVELIETEQVGDKHVEIIHIKLTGCFLTSVQPAANHETETLHIYFDQIDVLHQVRDPQNDNIKGSNHYTFDKATGTSAV